MLKKKKKQNPRALLKKVRQSERGVGFRSTPRSRTKIKWWEIYSTHAIFPGLPDFL